MFPGYAGDPLSPLKRREIQKFGACHPYATILDGIPHHYRHYRSQQAPNPMPADLPALTKKQVSYSSDNSFAVLFPAKKIMSSA
jgi:hypothetical protein